MKKFVFLASVIALSACVLACVEKPQSAVTNGTAEQMSVDTSVSVSSAVQDEVKNSN